MGYVVVIRNILGQQVRGGMEADCACCIYRAGSYAIKARRFSRLLAFPGVSLVHLFCLDLNILPSSRGVS